MLKIATIRTFKWHLFCAFEYNIMNNTERVNNMCNETNNNTNCNCIAEILKVINILQNEVCPGDTCLDTCTKAYFGPSTGVAFNTRPFNLYTCEGTPIAMPISNSPTETTTSTIFRVEKVSNCCATLRVLTYDETSSTYTATNSFFTVNTNCCSCIKCLGDTFVEGV